MPIHAPCFAGRRTPVPFVDQNQVRSLDGGDRDRLVAHVVGELVDVENLDPSSLEEVASVLGEHAGGDPGDLELFEVLARESFVGGEEEDAVEVRCASPVACRASSMKRRMWACMSRVLPLPVAIQKASLLSWPRGVGAERKRIQSVGCVACGERVVVAADDAVE